MSTSERTVFGGYEVVRTRDDREIRLDVRYPSLTVAIRRGAEDVDHLTLPYPRFGYGGHELLLSPDEEWLAMWVYSGQSEVGYELFTMQPALAHTGSLPYVHGEGNGPVFSPDSQRLALAWATLCLEEYDLDDQGRTVAECLFAWARVHVRELRTGAIEESRIDIRIPGGFPFEGNDSYYPELLELTNDEVRFETEWGVSVRVPIPLPESFTIAGPTAR